MGNGWDDYVQSKMYCVQEKHFTVTGLPLYVLSQHVLVTQ